MRVHLFAGTATATALASLLVSGAWPASQRPPEFASGLDLVRLSVTARDATGALVHDLTSAELRVREDGVEQPIERFGHHETPISVVVLFDRSTSMAGDKLMHAKDAVVNFAGALSLRDEALVIAFSDSIDALGEFGLDARTIGRATKRIDIEGGTRLYDAVLEASDAIAGAERHEKRALLLLSDGEDTASRATLDDAVEAVRRAGVPVYAIGIEMGPETAPALPRPWRPLRRESALGALERLTAGTGGWTYPIAAAKRCKEVCLRVADELRNQYLVGFTPHDQRPVEGWHTVAVETTRPGVVIATRAGYYRSTR